MATQKMTRSNSHFSRQYPCRIVPHEWHDATIVEAIATIADWLATSNQHELLENYLDMAVVSPRPREGRTTIGHIVAGHNSDREIKQRTHDNFEMIES